MLKGNPPLHLAHKASNAKLHSMAGLKLWTQQGDPHVDPNWKVNTNWTDLNHHPYFIVCLYWEQGWPVLLLTVLERECKKEENWGRKWQSAWQNAKRWWLHPRATATESSATHSRATLRPPSPSWTSCVWSVSCATSLYVCATKTWRPWTLWLTRWCWPRRLLCSGPCSPTAWRSAVWSWCLSRGSIPGWAIKYLWLCWFQVHTGFSDRTQLNTNCMTQEFIQDFCGGFSHRRWKRRFTSKKQTLDETLSGFNTCERNFLLEMK